MYFGHWSSDVAWAKAEQREQMILSIRRSFRRLPLWVQGWMVFLLIPANLFSLFFLSEYMGVLVCVLAIGGMAPNLLIIVFDRGLSKLMAIPHIILWTPLCLLILWMLIAKLTGSLLPILAS